jgi:hypothetical protein
MGLPQMAQLSGSGGGGFVAIINASYHWTYSGTVNDQSAQFMWLLFCNPLAQTAREHPPALFRFESKSWTPSAPKGIARGREPA